MRIAGRLPQPVSLIITLVFIIGFAFFGPLEKTLGINIRIVYFHGAWVWVGMTAFAVSALAGLVGLVTRLLKWHSLSHSLALTALLFWLTYLPISMMLMQMNWGGFFFDEPRWKVPFTFAIIALLLQAGLLLINNFRLSSAANFLYAVALFWSLNQAANILHPDSPIFESNSLSIQVFFVLLFLLTLLAGWQINSVIFKIISKTIEVGEKPC
ncbi:MAG: hypothetical protein AB9891_04890 [Anaerolineaceae bacterium]